MSFLAFESRKTHETPHAGDMDLRRGFSTLGCAEATLDEALALATEHRLDAIELRALGGTVELPRYLAAQYGSPAALAEKLRDNPVRIAALDTGAHLIGLTEAERAALLEFLPWAEALGVRWIRIFDGGKTADTTEIAQAAETLAWWRELRRARGWRADLMIETHDSLFTAAAIRRLLALAPEAAILWDSHHTWKKGGEEPVATWRAIRASVVHVHVKDSVSRPSARHPFTYVLPGDGEFPMAPLIATLREEKFGGIVSLEWERMWHPYLPPLAEALAKAANGCW